MGVAVSWLCGDEGSESGELCDRSRGLLRRERGGRSTPPIRGAPARRLSNRMVGLPRLL